MANTPNDTPLDEINRLWDKHAVPLTLGPPRPLNAECLLGNKPFGEPVESYVDCRGHLVYRTVAEGDAHRALIRAERQARADHAARHAEIVRTEVRNRRIAQGLCLRDTQCLLEIEHADSCVFDVRDAFVRRQTEG